MSALGFWVIVASIVLADLLGDLEDRIAVSTMTSMRFQPVGLVVIATVLNNQGGYLVPALIDKIIPSASAPRSAAT